MATSEYVCLACGSSFRVGQTPLMKSDNAECPRCSSANVMKVDLSRLFGFAGGGG